MSLASLLPKPKAQPIAEALPAPAAADAGLRQLVGRRGGPPPYRQRQNWQPRTVADYGDGGAFPEVHVLQYPYDMGRKKQQKPSVAGKGGVLPLQVDEEGNLRYDAILKQGHDDKRVVHSTAKDLMGRDVRESDDWARPDEEVVKETTDRTREALEKITQSRITANQPKGVMEKSEDGGPQIIKYVPSKQGPQYNSGASHRIIRLAEAPVDPMEPPKFKHKKLPRPPPSPPAPVMHSPPRKVSAEEQKEWFIPPSISNWKNRHGYTIPLDKRLASDGRGLQEVTINDNFAKLSEALFIADRHAREEVRLRAEMAAKLAAKEKKDKEERLRMLAQKAREERAGLGPSVGGSAGAPPPGAVTGANAMPVSGRPRAADLNDSGSDSDGDRGRRRRSPSGSTPPRRRRSPSDSRSRSRSGSRTPPRRRAGSDDEELDADARRKMRERDELRRERQKQRERELRLSHMGQETKQKYLSKNSERDISEKIALGIAQPTRNQETMFDARLFNRSEGIGSGLAGDDDGYNLYDKPLFAGSSASVIYKPPKATSDRETYGGVDMDGVEKMVRSGAPARGFQGTEGSANADRIDGPVQFEREAADPFGLDQFLGAAKRGREAGEGDGDDGRKLGLDAKRRKE
ncbi:SKIP/SNW domain-containing protein [Hyaloraphidium curvatum]|nr:SKIP/SNW domain-containing protein [Hyaloraphidium curvatum]